MGFFDKKYCDICGQKTGLIGSIGVRKTEDGIICKECNNKLSPWFDDRKHTTTADIKEQLEYREKNKAAVAAFSPTLQIGEAYQVLMIDEKNRTFTIAAPAALKNGNPDIVPCSDVKDVKQNITEHKREIKKKLPDGKEESFNPPRYEHSFDFHITIQVEHPYFNDMDFRLTSSAVEVPRLQLKNSAIYKQYQAMADSVEDALRGAAAPSAPVEAPAQPVAASAQTASAAAPETAPAPEPVSAAAPATIGGEWTCSYCGSKNTGDVCTCCTATKEEAMA